MFEQKRSCNFPGICVWKFENSIIKIYMSDKKKSLDSPLWNRHIIWRLQKRIPTPELVDVDIQCQFYEVPSGYLVFGMQIIQSNRIM